MSQGQEEVKFAAAEKAIGSFKLRDGNIHYSLLQKAQKPKKEWIGGVSVTFYHFDLSWFVMLGANGKQTFFTDPSQFHF